MFIFQIKKLTFLCFLEIFPGLGAQYCRSSGARGKLIRTDRKERSALVQLPSKVKKIFSSNTLAFFGRISLEANKRYVNTKAGY